MWKNWECSYRVKLYFGNSLHFFKAEPNICYTWHSFTNISNKSTFTVQLSMCIQFVSTLILHSLALVTPPHFSSLWTSCFYSFDIITHILVSDRPQRKEADAANLELFFMLIAQCRHCCFFMFVAHSNYPGGSWRGTQLSFHELDLPSTRLFLEMTAKSSHETVGTSYSVGSAG